MELIVNSESLLIFFISTMNRLAISGMTFSNVNSGTANDDIGRWQRYFQCTCVTLMMFRDCV